MTLASKPSLAGPPPWLSSHWLLGRRGSREPVLGRRKDALLGGTLFLGPGDGFLGFCWICLGGVPALQRRRWQRPVALHILFVVLNLRGSSFFSSCFWPELHPVPAVSNVYPLCLGPREASPPHPLFFFFLLSKQPSALEALPPLQPIPSQRLPGAGVGWTTGRGPSRAAF